MLIGPRDLNIRATVRRSILALLVLLVGTVAPLSAYGASAIGLSAGTFNFSTTRGKTLKGDLFVSNEGDTPIQVLIYTSDIIPDVKGVAQFVRPQPGVQPTPKSPASWTTINAPESTNIINNMPYVNLPVGKRSHVYFTIDIPKSAQPGDFSEAIFFEMFNLNKGAKGALSRIGGRLGCRISIRVQGRITEKVSVRPFSVGNFMFGSALPYSFSINNDGNIDHNFASTIQLLDSDENVRAKLVVGKADYVYAGSSKTFGGKVPAKSLGLGKYTAELRVAYMKEALGPGGREVRKTKTEIVRQRPFYVVPLVIVIPLVLVLLAVLLYLISIPARRRRRRDREQAGPGGPGIGPAPGGRWDGPPPPMPLSEGPPPDWQAQPAPVQPEPAEVQPPVEPEVQVPAETEPEPPFEPKREAAGEPEPVESEPEARAEAALPGVAERQFPAAPAKPKDDKPDWKRGWASGKYYGPEKPKDE